MYTFLQHFFTPAFSPFMPLRFTTVLEACWKEGQIDDRVILNLGSGTKRIAPNVINVDLYSFKNVDIVADITELPIINESCDMIILDSVLEHIPDPKKVINETTRVLKKGGFVYVTVPFLYPFHSSPNDYYRWTKEGLLYSFSDFTPVLSGVQGGPMAALQGVLMHIGALLFSFGSQSLYFILSQFFMILFSPLKLLDPIFIFFKNTHEVGADLYFVGQKK
jgi:SAM-dependent methyltransferase